MKKPLLVKIQWIGRTSDSVETRSSWKSAYHNIETPLWQPGYWNHEWWFSSQGLREILMPPWGRTLFTVWQLILRPKKEWFYQQVLTKTCVLLWREMTLFNNLNIEVFTKIYMPSQRRTLIDKIYTLPWRRTLRLPGYRDLETARMVLLPVKVSTKICMPLRRRTPLFDDLDIEIGRLTVLPAKSWQKFACHHKGDETGRWMVCEWSLDTH